MAPRREGKAPAPAEPAGAGAADGRPTWREYNKQAKERHQSAGTCAFSKYIQQKLIALHAKDISVADIFGKERWRRPFEFT